MCNYSCNSNGDTLVNEVKPFKNTFVKYIYEYKRIRLIICKYYVLFIFLNKKGHAISLSLFLSLQIALGTRQSYEITSSRYLLDCRASTSRGDHDRQAFSKTYYRPVASGHVLIHVHVQAIRVHRISIDHAALEIVEGW